MSFFEEWQAACGAETTAREEKEATSRLLDEKATALCAAEAATEVAMKASSREASALPAEERWRLIRSLHFERYACTCGEQMPRRIWEILQACGIERDALVPFVRARSVRLGLPDEASIDARQAKEDARKGRVVLRDGTQRDGSWTKSVSQDCESLLVFLPEIVAPYLGITAEEAKKSFPPPTTDPAEPDDNN